MTEQEILDNVDPVIIDMLRRLRVSAAIDHLHSDAPIPEWLKGFSSAYLKVHGSLEKSRRRPRRENEPRGLH